MNRRQQIFDRANALFRERGYQATSMRDIAAAVGMEAPSLYNHISGKHELLEESIMLVADLFTTGMREINEQSLKSKAKLERLIDLHVDITLKQGDAVSLLTNEWVHLSGKKAERFRELKEQYEADFRHVLEDYKSDYAMVNMDIDLVLFSMLSTLRWLYSWCNRNERRDGDRIKSHLKHLLIPQIP